MDDEVMNELIEEFRDEFHIPPFYDDSRFTSMLNEARQYLDELMYDIDYANDMDARSLLKNRMFYAHNNRLSDFFEDYSHEILHWQMSRISPEEDE